jgi:RNA ligase (TIGR02306 family)
MRKLARIVRIDEVNPILDADAIEVASVGGWKVVVKKNEYKAGELAVYFEIDSWIPHHLAPFLTKSGQYPKVYNGVEGQRLRTIKLRGQLSQGLLMPVPESVYDGVKSQLVEQVIEDLDLTDILMIQKWEAPISAQLAGVSKGSFPSFIRKTDQERIQNLKREYAEWQEEGLVWEMTEKLDGSSMTVFVNEEESGVCSRNLNLKESEENSFWKVAIRENLIDKIKSTGKNIALQGELVGPGIQGNKYNLSDIDFYLFDIYDIDKQEYYNPEQRWMLVLQLGLKHAPILSHELNFKENQWTIENVLINAEFKSLLNKQTEAEGVVFKSLDGKHSFKAISNKFLLKNDE